MTRGIPESPYWYIVIQTLHVSEDSDPTPKFFSELNTLRSFYHALSSSFSSAATILVLFLWVKAHTSKLVQGSSPLTLFICCVSSRFPGTLPSNQPWLPLYALLFLSATICLFYSFSPDAFHTLDAWETQVPLSRQDSYTASLKPSWFPLPCPGEN